MGLLFDYSGLVSSLKNSILKGMPNIAGIQYNARLLFEVKSGTIIINPETGNYEPETVTEIEQRARLISNPNSRKNNTDFGSPFNRIFMTGWLVTPLTFTGTYPERVPMFLLDNEIWKKGVFYPVLDTPTNVNENINIQSALGKKIQGFFELQGDLNT